jgi:hypothetical protein
MTSKGIIAYHNSLEMLIKHLAAFNVLLALKMVMQGFRSFFITGIVMSKTSGYSPDSLGSMAYDRKSNTNMHNYEHNTLLHNLLPGRS